MSNTLQVQESRPVMPKFLSIREVAKYTTLSRSSLCRLIKNGAIPFVKVGSRILISTTYLEGLKVKANKEEKV